MDTKLKNRHRISALLSIFTVVMAAVIMVELYPFFEKEAKLRESPAYENQTFLRQLILSNYVLDFEQAKFESGNATAPFDFFFPDAETEVGQVIKEDAEPAAPVGDEYQQYLRKLRSDCVLEYENWNRQFREIRQFLDYQVLAEDGSVMTDHADVQNILEDESYVFRAAFHYDERGLVDVVNVNGRNTALLLNWLQGFIDEDPMAGYYWEQYGDKSGTIMQNPRNMTFVYAMTQEQLKDYTETRESSWSSYYNSGMTLQIFAFLTCVVALLALLFSCFDIRRGDDSKVFRAPLEVVASIGTGGIAFGCGLTTMVAMTNQGKLYEGLMRADFLPEAADVLLKLWNILWWCLPFSIIYWSVICIRDVFHIGLKRYLRERTLCGWFCGWCGRLGHKMYGVLGNIDLQDKSDKTILKIVGINFLILAVLCSMWFFGIGALVVYSVILFIVLRKYYRDLRAKYGILLDATNQIANGNLDVNIAENLSVFEPLKTELEKIQSGFKVAVDEEVKSQKMKTDLITNMSHDLKTPLTAIITYVNLLHDDNVTPEQRKAYVDVLEKKSMRLKSLIEDLFEISKANSNNVTLNLVDVDIVNLLKEVSLELSDKIEESTIDFRWNLPDEKMILPLDSQKTYRIFDNLLTNIIKYAMPNTRAYIGIKREDDYVVISMKNISSDELNFNPDEITERFVRGDRARNTDGSGLGMAIAKSFVELQNGKMTVEAEADLFRVIIRWPIR